MNQVYKKLLNSKVDKFIIDFSEAKSLFEDFNKRNKLIHPGEFGMFRERLADEIIKFAIPEKYKTGTGFLINSFDEVSTQCDIIIYDRNNTPLIENESEIRFFPVETVIGIGEIKSNLNSKSLTDAVLKLAKNKKLRRIKNAFCINHNHTKDFDPPNNPMDTLFSFLICNEIESFDHEKFIEKINKIYTDNNIGYEFRHNAIISLKNGVFGYQEQNINKEKGNPPFPHRDFKDNFIELRNREGIIYLLGCLTNFLTNINIYHPDPMEYIY